MKHLLGIVNEGFNRQSNLDRRKKVNYIIAEYEDEDGHIYRKKFEYPANYSYDQMISDFKQKAR